MASSRVFLVFLLVAVSGLYQVQSASLKDVPDQRIDLIQGTPDPAERLLFLLYVKDDGRLGVVVQEDVYHADPKTVITRLTAIEQGQSKGALAYVVTGGVGKSDVVIRVASLINDGYYYLISIYGKDIQ